MNYEADIVIVGAGIAGSALARELAKNGVAVLILEKSLVHKDRVRGEWMAPWGVAEAKKLELYDLLLDAGGHHPATHLETGDIWSPDDAIANALDLSTLLPDVPGPLCLGHPQMCNLLNSEATRSGATLLRGVSGLRITTGERPVVEFAHDGRDISLSPRLVIGADGRNSVVRKHAKIEQHTDEPHHFMAGLLVEGAHDWPEHVQTIGTQGRVHYLVFPQGKGSARLYLCYDPKEIKPLSGDEGAARMLEAFRLDAIPHSESIANARAAGPCASFPNSDTWTDEPYVPGVLLIADAAGHNDPLLGQGLSIALRDVRMVRDLLLENVDWAPPTFAPYAEERRERMRRLRFSTRLFSVIAVEFGAAAKERRKRAFALMHEDPSAAMPRNAAFVGPELMPAEAFGQTTWDRLVNA